MNVDVVAKLKAGEPMTVDQWAEASRQKQLCGILGCLNPPSVRCPHCGNWYCAEHAEMVYHSRKE